MTTETEQNGITAQQRGRNAGLGGGMIVFNTGRTYTPNGQRIAAKAVGDNLVFVDVDRNIEGVIIGAGRANFDQASVMFYYDAGVYGPAWFVSESEAMVELAEVARRAA